MYLSVLYPNIEKLTIKPSAPAFSSVSIFSKISDKPEVILTKYLTLWPVSSNTCCATSLNALTLSTGLE